MNKGIQIIKKIATDLEKGIKPPKSNRKNLKKKAPR